jgi:hypothetical protein
MNKLPSSHEHKLTGIPKNVFTLNS